MGKKDLTGRRFGELTVTGPTKQRKDGYVLWQCRCACGNQTLASTKMLNRGTVKSCGCKAPKTARNGNRAEDLTGRRFGRLTVRKRAGNHNGRTAWECTCDCGGG